MQTCLNCSSFNPNNQPRNNCERCWDYYFKLNRGRVLAVESGLKSVGPEKVQNVTGAKFLKHYFKFKERQNDNQKES